MPMIPASRQIRCVGLLWLVSALPAAATTTVYQCVAANGQRVYQDQPCVRSQQQKILTLQDVPTMAPAPASAAPSRSTATAAPASPDPSVEPVAPLATMYGCSRATDGKVYLSANGAPAAYLAPFGMLGAAQLSLSEAYDPTRSGAGGSEPQFNRGRVTSELVASDYVWVQDQCRMLTPAEICHVLRDEYDLNARKLKRAFKSDRTPLEQRDHDLRAQLDQC